MDNVKASEFGKLIGESRQYINTNCKRGKIIKGEDGLFDLDHPVNKTWYDIKRADYIAREAKPEIKNKPEKKINGSSKEELKPDQEKVIIEGPEIEVEERATFAVQKQQAELDLKLLNIQEKKIELEKKQGKLLNIDTANKITMAYMSMFKKSLHRDIETLIHKICDVYKIDLEEKAKYVNELIGIMNNSSDRTMEELMNSLQTEDVEL